MRHIIVRNKNHPTFTAFSVNSLEMATTFVWVYSSCGRYFNYLSFIIFIGLVSSQLPPMEHVSGMKHKRLWKLISPWKKFQLKNYYICLQISLIGVCVSPFFMMALYRISDNCRRIINSVTDDEHWMFPNMAMSTDPVRKMNTTLRAITQNKNYFFKSEITIRIRFLYWDWI